MSKAAVSISQRDPRRRIAVISMHTSPTAPLGLSANGGLNVYVREICSEFSERGIATDVFTRSRSELDRPIEQLTPFSRVINLPIGRGVDKYALYNEVPAFASEVTAFAAEQGIGYDLIYSHYWLSGEVACIARSRLQAPWAHTAHTLGLVKNRNLAAGARPEPPLRIQVEGEVVREADMLVVSTPDEGEDLVTSYGADSSKISVVAPGVDLRTFTPIDRQQALRRIGYEGTRLVLFVGRLERLKGIEVALRAMALLNDRNHGDVRLLVLGEDSRDGDESEKERLKALALQLGVRDRIDFGGSVPHNDLPYYYSAAEVCVMPSYSESFGLVGLEAQASGCPVVASNVSGLRSVVRDEVTGYLIDGDDAATYAERIGRLLASPELARQMGRRGTLLAQRFSWSRTADRLEVAFDDLVERSRKREQVGVQD